MYSSRDDADPPFRTLAPHEAGEQRRQDQLLVQVRYKNLKRRLSIEFDGLETIPTGVDESVSL